MTNSEKKKVLRETLRQRRELVTEIDVQKASSDVSALLIQHVGAPKGKRLHVYTAKASWKEIDTAPYIAWLKDQDKTVSIDIATHMAVQAIPTKQYDIVIVPTLGFDSELQRLGMGMGWYDMFLAKQQHAIKIGVAYDWAEIKNLITEEHDVAMDVVVTPSRVLRR
jgi:5-formyltetrahydrofolate cyclo-ligase